MTKLDGKSLITAASLGLALGLSIFTAATAYPPPSPSRYNDVCIGKNLATGEDIYSLCATGPIKLTPRTPQG